MFEAIKHSYTSGDVTGATYFDGDVMGNVSFSSTPERTCIISSIGPDDALRQCASGHWLSKFRNRYRAHVSEEVESYA